MSKRLSLIAMLALGLSFGSVACGDDDDDDDQGAPSGDGASDGESDDEDGDDSDGDNVSACNDWKNAVSCSGADLSALNALDCNTYGSLACDISGYFDCLTDNTGCNGGMLDVSGWGSCANLAVCN